MSRFRFLFIIADSWGPLGCTIPVARELASRGHEVKFAVFDFHGFINRSNDIIPALDAAQILRDEGLDVLEVSAPPLKLPGKVPTPKNFLLEYRAFQSLFRDYLIPYYEHWLKYAIPVFQKYDPSAVWVKDQVLAGAMASEKLGVPWATFSVHTGFVESDDSLPWTMGLSPPESGLERMRNKAMKWGMRKFRMSLDDVINEARVRAGLPAIEDALFATPVSPHLYLLFVAPEFEPPRASWPAHVRFVGPYCWDKPRDYAPPRSLERIPSDRPLVYATIGTLSNRMEIDFYTTIMEALGDQPYTVVVSVGAYKDDYVASRLPKPPDNFIVESFLPNSMMIPRADVLVHHGGAGTTMMGLARGVPAVAVPLNHEHLDFAQRLVERNCGIRIDKKKLSAENLRAAVGRIFKEPSYKQAAQKAKSELARYDAVRSCANELLGLAAGQYMAERRSIQATPAHLEVR
ncbi:glycosyltransferase [Pendulispora albinea]|uniref:Erythromycin biosynthesis protein CIII-like C-terminal domain-containing protein n=1 Tax=Pendulispora albinea TaxID=2741071 RepID=A0ABZ2MBR7_9BACT